MCEVCLFLCNSELLQFRNIDGQLGTNPIINQIDTRELRRRDAAFQIFEKVDFKARGSKV